MRTLLVVALAACLLLAGCATKKDDDSPSTTTSTSETSTSSSNTGSSGGPGASATNHAPTASLQANATQIGNVTFILNATDADGDALSYVLSFGDNASANGTLTAGMPVNVTHDYTQAGLYNVSLNVTDGRASTVVTLQLNLTAGSTAAPFPQFVASGTPDLACPQCTAAGANTGAGYRGGVNELDSWFVTIPADAVGQPFVLTSESGNPDMVFRTTCASSGTAVGNSFVGTGAEETGVVPEGALCVLTWNPDDVVAKITLTIG